MADTNPSTPRCERCGYDLSGIHGAGDAVCPECAHSFEPGRPWVPVPWPPAWRVALRLCGPALGAAMLLILFSVVPILQRYVVWPLWIIWLAALAYAALWWPFVDAGNLARHREPHATRRRMARRLAVGAALVNLTAAAAGVVVLIAT